MSIKHIVGIYLYYAFIIIIISDGKIPGKG